MALDIGLARRRTRGQGLPRPVRDIDFVAIDFETANSSRTSACAVGVALVRDGRVIDAGSTLINPDAEFSDYNIAVNHIHPADDADAPEFADIWPQLAELLDGQTIAAHVASFDIGVVRSSVARDELDGIDATAVCSWRLSKVVWPDLPAYGLGYVGKHLGIEFDHHNAGEDAGASANVILHAERKNKVGSVRGLCDRLGMTLGTLDPSSFTALDLSQALGNVDGDADADPNHPLYGQCLCFTGAMFSMQRKEAAERITVFGADFKNSMSAKVDILVIGDADFVAFADGHQTGKLKRAAQLEADGDEVEIISEKDFLALLQS